ncbi:Clavaminate synthase-like protein [Parathielavia hyrcaniae]|uniref:Clavaminate synthase-like protein n=1 Tax=Parathielavia hyrcaniae TaxID=113614 RepID=A0AAN6QCI1_9PEZI|nr:Clavaminate synthase-like protein [Parathielavia hyrcaniae]
MEVGFLYLRNVGISDELFKRVIEDGRAFFDIPEEEKLKIEMKNAPSFLGYSRLSAEVTAGAIDHREQIDLSTEHPLPGPDAPRYYNLLAPNQWPSPAVLPNFRPLFTEYMKRMGEISIHFTSLIAEAIELPSGAFNKYFDADQQHKLKIVKYPDVGVLGAEGKGGNQGVGPHKDSSVLPSSFTPQISFRCLSLSIPRKDTDTKSPTVLSSYLLQASHHRGLQVQNMRGDWIDCPPIEGTLVVAIGQGLEALTRGVCASTTHRVLSPAAGRGARFSIPFFQGVSGDADFGDLERVGVGEVPGHVREQRRRVLERNGGRLDDVEFTFRDGGVARTLGEATLRNRVKSHPDVGERWYPDILASVREERARLREGQGGAAG